MAEVNTVAPNTPNHHPLVDQPNTPSMEASAQAMASPSVPSNPEPNLTTPIMERTQREIDTGRKTIDSHANARENFQRQQEQIDRDTAPDPAKPFDELDDGTPLIRDVGGDTTPVTLEDGTQARVAKSVADAARAADRARSADMGTGKFPRNVDPRDPAVRKEEASADPDRNVLRGPASTGVKTADADAKAKADAKK